ncbi:hypothetical protein G3435_20655 [Pseudomonas sp. MAFF212428]|uniref:Uncharacterized protein n=1 Tax=Pseudomonas brassicae TaxID=2708063 RepID=A0A6B3NTZ8_9PSED|nr:hypothetical protein [Pseudomonas brassicae]NER61710.1 hypothetical protein [Pseudomonas brassicae]NER65416.1 hypothetical protein [Pseudomonas brassicae]
MSQTTYTVFLPDRPLPIRIEADSFVSLGCELVLHKGQEMVARTSDRGFVVRTDLALESCSQAESLHVNAAGVRVEHIAPATMSELKGGAAPVWWFLAGAVVVGIATVVGLVAKL